MTAPPAMDEVRAAYRARGIGGALMPGSRPAVVVVDFITGFTDPAWAPGFACDREVEATAELLEAARAAGAPVIFTTIIFDKARQPASVWLAKMPAMECLVPDSPAIEVDNRLSPRPQEPLVVKTAASCFTGTDLATLLVQIGVDTVLVCGATTSGCVRATVVDACMGGWRPFVVRDCVADRAAEVHDASLFDMQAKYGEVIDLATAIDLFKGAKN